MKKSKNLAHSFQAAFSGIGKVLASERNFQIHVLIGFIVILAAIFFQISRNDLIFLLIIIGMVLTMEIVNTGFELMFDILHPLEKRNVEQDLAVRIIKDMLAGAVLISAILALIIGVLIFYPYVINLT